MYSVGNWTVHFMNARGELTPYIDTVQKALEDVHERSKPLVPTTILDIEVEAARYGGVPNIGHSGYVPRPGLMRLMLDPYDENLAQNLGEPMGRMIAHELHHALRWDTVGYGTTLIGALVSEGLCGKFTAELYGNNPEQQECAIPADQIQCLSREALVEAHSEDYDHDRWFFGKKDLPNWAGYTIGFELVGLAMESMKLNPSEMIAIPAEEFIGSLETLCGV